MKLLIKCYMLQYDPFLYRLPGLNSSTKIKVLARRGAGKCGDEEVQRKKKREREKARG